MWWSTISNRRNPIVMLASHCLNSSLREQYNSLFALQNNNRIMMSDSLARSVDCVALRLDLPASIVYSPRSETLRAIPFNMLGDLHQFSPRNGTLPKELVKNSSNCRTSPCTRSTRLMLQRYALQTTQSRPESRYRKYRISLYPKLADYGQHV